MASSQLQIVVVSGLSGSGKSVALHCFEDLGYFCVDNLPPPLLMTFINLCADSSYDIARVALGVDIRERLFLEDFISRRQQLMQQGLDVTVLFLDAEDEVLIRRFSESRRPHPLAPDRPVREGITLERQRLAQLRDHADRIVDTSRLTVHDLNVIITRHYQSTGGERVLHLNIVSFGYKYGVPNDVDIVFDARCLPNPHFVEELKPHTGEDARVSAFVLGHTEAKLFLEHIFTFLDFVLPLYEREGRSYLTIGIGCTGGKHRSVVLASQLSAHVSGKGYHPSVHHRDLAAKRS